VVDAGTPSACHVEAHPCENAKKKIIPSTSHGAKHINVLVVRFGALSSNGFSSPFAANPT
jgi:hypothetical protein